MVVLPTFIASRLVTFSYVADATKATEVILPKPKRTEFLSLVTSFSPKNTETELLKLEENRQPLKKFETQPHTDLKESFLGTRLSRGVDNVSDKVKAVIESRKLTKLENKSLPYVAPSERFKTNAVAFQRSKKASLELLDPDNLPDKIPIPKEKWIPGRLYRVDDSFYSDEGDFLYRVPGLKFS